MNAIVGGQMGGRMRGQSVHPPLLTFCKNYGSEVNSNRGRLVDTQAVPTDPGIEVRPLRGSG